MTIGERITPPGRNLVQRRAKAAVLGKLQLNAGRKIKFTGDVLILLDILRAQAQVSFVPAALIPPADRPFLRESSGYQRMKRRERARPLVVEVKHSRQSSPSKHAFLARGPVRSGSPAWPRDPAAETPPADLVVATPPAAAEPQPPAGRPRRVLPALVPTFMAVEPDPIAEAPAAGAAPARTPRKRRVRTAEGADAQIRVAAPRPVPPVIDRTPAVAVNAAPANLAEVGKGERPRTAPRGPRALKPGERWKRRLPRAAW